jgi:outer membrane protein assembly factor BamB
LLTLVFAALVGYQKFYATVEHQQADEALADELANAIILDEPPTGPTPEWPQWRGPLRDGVAHFPDLLTAWSKGGPAVLWQAPSGQGYSAVAVAGGRAFTLVRQQGGEAVVCWDAATGKERWRRAYDVNTSPQYPGPRATPSVDGDRVYTLSATGLFHCLDAATGAVRWDHDLRHDFQAAGGQWGHACSPLVEGRLVILMPGGRGSSVVAFDKQSGDVAWRALDDQAGYSSPVAFSAKGLGGRQIVCFTGNAVAGLAPESGKVSWRYPWQTSFDVNAATPLVFQARRRDGPDLHYVFISSGYNHGCALLKIDESWSGELTARLVFQNNKLCSHFASPVRKGAYVYGFNEDKLVCMDLRTGDVFWRETRFAKGSLMRVDDFLLVLGERGELALVEATPQKCHVVASAKLLGDHCWTMPVFADGRAFLRDENQVLCVNLKK